MRPVHLSLVLSFAALTFSPFEAVAQPARGGAREMDLAEKLFHGGLELLGQQKWQEAEGKFREAWALMPRYDVAANLGQLEARLGKPRDAAEHLSFAIRNWPITAKREPRELAEKKLAELKRALVTFSIHVDVAGATVSVNGADIGPAPIEFDVFANPGPTVVEAKLAGYEVAKRQVEGAAGASENVELTLAQSRTVGGPPPLLPPTTPAPAKNPVLIGVGLGVTALGVSFAIGGFAASGSNNSSAATMKQSLQNKGGTGACLSPANAQACADLDRAYKNASGFRAMGIAGVGVGGAAALATLTYVLVPQRAADNRPKVGGFVGPRAAGLDLSASF